VQREDQAPPSLSTTGPPCRNRRASCIEDAGLNASVVARERHRRFDVSRTAGTIGCSRRFDGEHDFCARLRAHSSGEVDNRFSVRRAGLDPELEHAGRHCERRAWRKRRGCDDCRRRVGLLRNRVPGTSDSKNRCREHARKWAHRLDEILGACRVGAKVLMVTFRDNRADSR
jgi:hypothetical protein